MSCSVDQSHLLRGRPGLVRHRGTRADVNSPGELTSALPDRPCAMGDRLRERGISRVTAKYRLSSETREASAHRVEISWLAVVFILFTFSFGCVKRRGLS